MKGQERVLLGAQSLRERLFFYYRKGVAVIAFLALWEVAPRLGLLDRQFIPPLSEIFVTMGQMWGVGGGKSQGSQMAPLYVHILVSLKRTALGFFSASAIALPLGFLLGGWFKRFEEYLNPLLTLLAKINPFSMFPVFIILFGIGELTKVVIILWVSVWPILFGTINGVRGIDPLLVKAALAMGTPKLALFWKVVLPGAAPHIFAGLKQGGGTSFFMLIAAEMIGATAGLGFLVANAQVNFQMRRLFVAVIIIAILGLLLNWLLERLERRALIWKEDAPMG
ncbi:MAG: ABC transporter permease [Spirochaetaceae bacterium]|jgi:NitT/TauT family transport system permease protein|nr:ABC transporter permease [Spirochaetaceae bacterium]